MLQRSIIALIAMSATFPVASGAQIWNDERTLGLVRQGADRRASQIADTALADYSATAHGYLTFLAQLGEGFTEPPKIVKADELALEVYWRAPNLSKQLIVGRRDTLLLPTDINYHRDHLGIVQNNFPSIIRLGEGDEVRDVPHPLSAAGLAEYDFAIRDSLQIHLGPRVLDVYEVRVRPKNDRAPRAVGAVYLDRESGEVVRMAFSFTRAALIDKELEDVSVVLENGLIEGRFWLPRRQEIEIRRTGQWLDYPARGIIRGRWEICCYKVNRGLSPAMFAGPEIMLAPRRPGMPSSFVGQILDSLPPDVRAVTDADVAKVQEEARALVRGQALARTRSAALSARSFSDIVRVNRVEGLAVGSGITQRLGNGFSVTARGRYGFSDERVKGRAELAYRTASGAGATITGYRDHREAAEEPETSRVRNSIAAQEFGSDYTDPYLARGGSLTLLSPVTGPWNFSAEAAIERQATLMVNASPARGVYEPTIAASNGEERRITLAANRPTRLTFLGLEARVHAEVQGIAFRQRFSDEFENFGRASATLNLELPVGTSRLMLHTIVAGVFGLDSVPAQHLVLLGGPTSGAGYRFHQFAGLRGFSQRAEIGFPAPFPSFRLGRYGRTPATMTLAPFAQIIWSDARRAARLGETATKLKDGWYPSIGIGALSFFDLIRFDVARGLRDGRWTFSVDVGRELWGIL
jgi:hypothetical protein